MESPGFPLPTSLASGVMAPLELAADNGFEVWRDTLAVGIAGGGGRTPPRVLGLSTRRVGRDLRIILPMSQVLEGGEPEKAVASISSAPDSSAIGRIDRIDLRRDPDAFTGTWQEPAAGDYFMTVEVEDGAGNRGRGELHDLVKFSQKPRSTPTRRVSPSMTRSMRSSKHQAAPRLRDGPTDFAGRFNPLLDGQFGIR